MEQKKFPFVNLSEEDAVREIIVDTIFGLWGMVNNLTRLRPSKKERYRITIFGSARSKPGTQSYIQVKKLSSELAKI